jgi:hypothetical protein
MSQAAIDKIRKLKADYEKYSQLVLNIRTKSGKIEPFVLNESQRYLHERIEDQIRRTGKARVVVLKGRQQGISTYTQGRYYWRTSMNRGRQAFILTHEAEATLNLFTMTKRFHELNTKTVGGIALAPATGKDSANALHFSVIDSGYKVGTAGNKAVGRGSTIQFFHGSEVGFWPNAEEHLKGVLQAVPDQPGTEVILESTANGVGGVFYDYVMQAQRGEGEYELVFIPWFWQTEYSKPIQPDFKRTDDEQSLVNLYGLTDEQLNWRRAKIHELKGTDAFKQEYPCNVQEAFLFSGRGAFDPNWLDWAQADCYSPEKIVEVTSQGWIEQHNGRLKVFESPKPGQLYAVGADIAEGLDGGDYTVVDVSDAQGNQVAVWHGHIDPDLAGDLIKRIGDKYNRAFIGVERNNHGLTTLTRLRDLGYTNLYAQESLESRSEGDQTKRFGWLTTSKSKPLIIDRLIALARDRGLGVADIECVNEMREYIVEPNGSFNARSGAKDDRVMARAICLEMVRRMPKHRSQQAQTSHNPVNTTGY